VNVEIWSDVACPWCYVGKRRFAAALADFEHRDEVDVTWRSFELDPGAPRIRDVDAATHLASRYGMSREEALARQHQLGELAARDGLELHLDRSRGGNTFDAHRLLKLADAHGLQDTLKEELMRAYHSAGEAIGDHATLERIAVGAGLPATAVREVLAGERFADEVRGDVLRRRSRHRRARGPVAGGARGDASPGVGGAASADRAHDLSASRPRCTATIGADAKRLISRTSGATFGPTVVGDGRPGAGESTQARSEQADARCR